MKEIAIERLQHLCTIIPSLLREIDEHSFSLKPSSGKWSKKEIIGHLIDSAANNHQRFVRGQFEDIPKITYDPDNWNKFNFYNEISKEQIISFWEAYNKQLLELIKLIPKESLKKECNTGGENLSLEFLITDYIDHMEHHLKQVVLFK